MSPNNYHINIFTVFSFIVYIPCIPVTVFFCKGKKEELKQN